MEKSCIAQHKQEKITKILKVVSLLTFKKNVNERKDNRGKNIRNPILLKYNDSIMTAILKSILNGSINFFC